MSHTVIHLKVLESSYSTFGTKAEELGKKPSTLLREMIEAVNEDRLTIQPNEGQRRLFGIEKEIVS